MAGGRGPRCRVLRGRCQRGLAGAHQRRWPRCARWSRTRAVPRPACGCLQGPRPAGRAGWAWPAPARTGLGEWGVWAPGTVPFAAGRGRSFSFAQRGDPSVVADSLTSRVSDVYPASSPQRQSVACPVGPGPGLQFQARPFWKGLEFALHQSEPQWGGTWASRPGSPVGRVRCRAGHLTSFVPVVLLPAAESESPPWGWGRAGPGSLCVGQWAACVYRV